jgi:uncharacterized membrane protein YfcA
MEIMGYILAIVVGITLGLIGGGGSILTVPILVYIFSIKPELATTYSLFIVGISSLIGSIKHYKLGNLKVNAAVGFGIPALVSLLTIRKLVLPQIPQELFTINNFIVTKDLLLMIVFAVLMIAASTSMIKKSKVNNAAKLPNKFSLAIIGLLVGTVTGFLGAGGGFLIIPALVFFASLEMKQAVGTSLIIIATNALIGFGGDMLNNVVVDFKLLFIFSALSIVGIFIGTNLSKKIDGNKLKPAFGWFVLVMGIYIIIKEVFFK